MILHVLKKDKGTIGKGIEGHNNRWPERLPGMSGNWHHRETVPEFVSQELLEMLHPGMVLLNCAHIAAPIF
jgi:hypothetical protein